MLVDIVRVGSGTTNTGKLFIGVIIQRRQNIAQLFFENHELSEGDFD